MRLEAVGARCMQTVARGEFQPSASSCALTSTSIVAALVAGEDLGQLALGRLAGDGLGLDADVAERLGDVVGVAHAGGVDDAGTPLKRVL